MDIPSTITNSFTPLTIRTKSPEPYPLCHQHASPLQFSSHDSGYGSESISPEQPSTPHRAFDNGNSSYTLDGSGPDSPCRHGNVDVADAYPGSVFLTPAQRLAGLATPGCPKTATTHSPSSARSSLPSAFFSRATPRSMQVRSSDLHSSCIQASSPRPSTCSPDRFVYPRDSNCTALPLAERFRLTKPAEDLTATEKILRHGEASADVFSLATLRNNPVPTYANERQAAFQRAGFPPLTRARTTLDTTDIAEDDAYEVEPGPARGSVWSVRTVPPIAGAIDSGRGSLIQTGTSAPFFMSEFVHSPRRGIDDENKYSGRLAAALDFDRASRVLQCNVRKSGTKPRSGAVIAREKAMQTNKTTWNGSTWAKDREKAAGSANAERCIHNDGRPVRILSAPKYRDDFYCSLLAYSSTSDTIVVGLGDLLYSWSEANGATHLNGGNDRGTWLTSLAFSSADGGRDILAFGRSNCVFGLMALAEASSARILIQESAAISCLSWRPTCSMRPSKSPEHPGVVVATEDLLVGTDTGTVLYYVVEWPDKNDVDRNNWQGDISLVSRISVHNQQICGLAWAPDGASFATGGNDNQCFFFHTDDVLPRCYRPGGTGKPSDGQPRGSLFSDVADSHLALTLSTGGQVRRRIVSEQFVRRITPGTESWRWEHGAAVKAIAFCPWQDGLVATGGGSNDRCIHFFHTTSGAALATIFVSSQVTSLIWSTTRREIAVTFGFAHPGHDIRIAVYSWPGCKQVAAIPWEGEHRALYGISCSKGPRHGRKQALKRTDGSKDEDGNPTGKRRDRTLNDGCIAVASSEETVKFYELWPADNKPVIGGSGMLGGSDILEDLEGIQKEGDVIR